MSTTYTLEELQSQLTQIQAALGVKYKPEVYRDIWANDVRLIIAGQDVTYFRNQISQFSGYQLIEPHAYGPANFAFPQINALEIKSLGVNNKDLWWAYPGAPVELVEVVGGVYGERLWAGFIASRRMSTDNGLMINCGGDFAGRLSLRDNPALLFIRRLDRGRLIYNAVQGMGVSIQPRLGPETGYIGDNTVGGATMLDYINNQLARCIRTGGNQWTIARTADSRGYEMRLKDLTTVHATVFAETEGVVVDVGDDIAEKPTDIYGIGIDRNGRKIVNAVAPNWIRGPMPRYPFDDERSFGLGTTNEDTDTGVGIRVLEARLVAIGLLTRDKTGTGEYDKATERAVKSLQRNRLDFDDEDVTGRINLRTWRKLFDVTESGRSTFNAEVLPFAQLRKTRVWNRTASGLREELNPFRDPARIVVDQTFDHGTGVSKDEMDDWSEAYLDRVHRTEGLIGTLELDGADLFVGDVSRLTPAGSLSILPRHKLREGWNIKVVWDGNGTQESEYSLFHVGGVDVSGDTNVRAAIDTDARDLPTIGEILARRKETRRRPGREWITEYRKGTDVHSMVPFSEIGGLLDQDVDLEAGWNRIEVPTGQQGQIARIRLRLRSESTKGKDPDDESEAGVEYVVGVSELEFGRAKMAELGGDNPLDKESKWHKPKTQRNLKRDYLFYYTAGQWKQPLGYYPGSKLDDEGKASDDPLTGNWDDEDGFEYHASGRDSCLYVYIFVDRDCILRAGRILWPAAEQS